jgi:predicted RNase H-like HicB family nuclease/predicted nucleotidyltransferase
MPKKTFKYRVRIHFSAEDEGYIAAAPELPGCSAFGETPEEAMKELQVAAELWLQAANDMARSISPVVNETKPSGKMPLDSPNFVEIEYFPKDQVWEALRTFVRELRRHHPEIERVIVFGSLVRGDAVPGSDVDLLLVLRESNLSFLDRIPRYLPSRFPVGVDVFPYTREELERMLNDGSPFVREVLARGDEIG